MSYTMRTTATFLFVVFSATLSFGSVRRVEISKTTQVDSPIEFSVTITPDSQQEGHVLVELVLPSGQKELADLWKVYLWILQDKKTVLGVPLDPTYAKDKTITVRYHGHVDTVNRCLIAIRCGKRAPLSETIYQINVGSYLTDGADHRHRKALKAGNKRTEAESNHPEWLAKALRAMATIKAGNTREDLLKVFQEEGGLSTRTQRRYVYRGSRYIKVDVTLEAVGDPADELAESPKDKITKISKPFLEWSITD